MAIFQQNLFLLKKGSICYFFKREAGKISRIEINELKHSDKMPNGKGGGLRCRPETEDCSSIWEDKEKNGNPVVAVVDGFLEKDMLIDNSDDIPDMTHGDTVPEFTLTECPNANILELNIDELNPQGEYEIGGNKIKENFFEITKEAMFKGHKADAVNFSIVGQKKISDLANETGLPLTADNLHIYKDQIREGIKNNYNQINSELTIIESITEQEVPVYVAAGNTDYDECTRPDECVTLYSFAKGVTTVGALDEHGNNIEFDNSMVTKRQRGNYTAETVDSDSDGKPDSYDFTDDGIPDFSANDASGALAGGSPIDGTSFATPTEVGKYLAKQGLCR